MERPNTSQGVDWHDLEFAKSRNPDTIYELRQYNNASKSYDRSRIMGRFIGRIADTYSGYPTLKFENDAK